MRLLVAVAHYFKPGNGRHGSLSKDPAPRLNALRQLIIQLHQLFGEPAAVLNHMDRKVEAVADGGGRLDIRICIEEPNHLINDLTNLKPGFTAVSCKPSDPLLLGFCCHQVLAEAWAEACAAGIPYDYVCYLEDDILITDADFFLKLRMFNNAFGDAYLLMPNRLETAEHLAQVRRFYIDGNYNPAATSSYRKSGDRVLALNHLGEMVQFEQPSNLHSGCFFLNRSQAAVYFASEQSRIIDTGFHGPLESAATLGMLKTFQLMKPSLTNGRFLSVQHAGRNFMGLVSTLS